MKKVLFFVSLSIIIILIFPFLYFSNFPHYAFVKEVIDGDTVQLQNGQLLRYLGLNTPEIKERNSGVWMKKNSYWGRKAYLYNKKLVENRNIRIEYDRRRKDKYGRLLAYVFTENTFVNRKLLNEGLAVIDIRYPDFKYEKELAQSFKQAREKNKGIWSVSKYLTPYEIKGLEGEVVVLEGIVLDIYEGKNVILFFMPANFKLVIFKNNLQLFNRSEIMKLKNKRIRVYGMIKKYKGRYEMVIHHPYQMEVLE